MFVIIAVELVSGFQTVVAAARFGIVCVTYDY